MKRSAILCSTSSLLANEPLPGTAPRADVWMLLEYDGVWGKKAFEESLLPNPVKAHLNDLRKQIPNSRLLLIRRHLAHRIARRESRLAIKPNLQSIHFYLAVASEHNPLLYDFILDTYNDLLELDIPGAYQGSMYSANLSSQQLLLVCTNGRRDWCCARYGADIYQDVIQSETPSLSVWQSSHLGGHRFAPNIACFPEGLFYGRIVKDDLRELIDSCSHGKMYPGKARGRSCYPAHVQAAEIYIQKQADANEPGDYLFTGAVERQPDEWLVDFQSIHTGRVSSLAVREETSPEKVFKSCNDAEPVTVRFYKVVDYRKLEE